MSKPLDANNILEDFAPEKEKKQKRRSAKDNKGGESNGPPAKKGGIPSPQYEIENIDPLIQQAPFVEEPKDNDDQSDRHSSVSHRSEDQDGIPYDPVLAAIAQDVLSNLDKTDAIAEGLKKYATAVGNIWKPLNENLVSIQAGLNLRNNVDKAQFDEFMRQLHNKLRELHDLKEKPPTTRYDEKLSQLEQQVGSIDTKLTLIQNVMNNILSFLNGMSAQRIAIPSQETAYSARSQGPSAPHLLPGQSAQEIVKVCILCAEKSNGTHWTQGCTRYRHFADRLKRAIDIQICTKCLERYDDVGDTHIHQGCSKHLISCIPCVKTFGNNVSASHDGLFCPLAKPDKQPKERQHQQKKADNGPSKPQGYLSGAFNS